MNKNSVWNILFVLFLTLGQFTTTESVSAKPNQEEAPQVPNLLSPGNGSMASSNPPTLCAQASDPDGNLQGIKFEVNGGGEGNHISPFVQVDGNGVACWQDNSPWSEQDHAWQARSEDAAGNQSGASGQWNIKIPVTTTPAEQSETCTVNELYADRPAPQTVGTTINFTVVATCGSGINKIETFVDGSGVGTIYSGSGTISWNTNGYSRGNHVFSVQVIGNSGGSAGRSHPYDLVNNTQEQQQTNPNSAFGNCEAIKIGNPVYIIVKEGNSIQRRHVPNPETLDALGFSQQAINNKGFSDAELNTIGQGSDIPDVVVDPNGFNTFKSTFCPNRNAVPNQSTAQLPAGQFDPHASGVCPGWETRLWIGAYARVTNAGDQLKLRTGPTINDSVITKMSAGQKFTVIGGPQCNDSYTWWNIQGDMGTGWAAEAGDKWWMAPMTEPPTATTEQVAPNSTQQSEQTPLVEAPIESNDDISWWCSNVGWFCNITSEAAASEDTNTECNPQCITEARRVRSDLVKKEGLWAYHTSTAKQIYEVASTSPVFILDGQVMQVRVRDTGEAPEANDIVIWPKGCGDNSFGIVTFYGGHIGTVVSNNDGKLIVHDANWNNNCGIRDEEVALLSCMQFISSPYPSIQPQSFPPEPMQSANACAQYDWPKSWFCEWGWIQ